VLPKIVPRPDLLILRAANDPFNSASSISIEDAAFEFESEMLIAPLPVRVQRKILKDWTAVPPKVITDPEVLVILRLNKEQLFEVEVPEVKD